ncbi:MAG: hypothetical protein MI810_24960 [Flavobacteriales bacterium]|nr:hypothetical protein [Flavobacteriales bacterium]
MKTHFLISLFLISTTVFTQPKEVYVNYAINRIAEVDYVNQRFEIDFYLQMYWEVDTLELKRKLRPFKKKLSNRMEVPVEILDWLPENDFTNAKDIDEKRSTDYSYIDGYILADTRYYGTFYNQMILNDFPFDDQLLIIELEDFKKTTSELVFRYGSPFDTLETTHTQLINNEPTLDSIKSADTILISSEVAFETVVDFSEFHLNPEVKAIIDTNVYEFTSEEQIFSRLQFVLNISRNPEFYLSKIISISTLIVLISWLIFFMHPEKFIERSNFGITVFAALIGHNFIINSLLPKISYLTTMDYFTLGTNILVCVPIVETVIIRHIYLKKGHAVDAEKLILVDRITFVSSVLLLAALIFFLFQKSITL